MKIRFGLVCVLISILPAFAHATSTVIDHASTCTRPCPLPPPGVPPTTPDPTPITPLPK